MIIWIGSIVHSMIWSGWGWNYWVKKFNGKITHNQQRFYAHINYVNINSFHGLSKMEFNWLSLAKITDNSITIISAIYGAISFFRTIFTWLTDKLKNYRLRKYIERGKLLDYLNRKSRSLSSKQRAKTSKFLAEILLDQNKKREYRRDAAVGLGEIQIGLRDLAMALHSDSEVKVRCAAAESLGKLKDKAAVPHLLLHCSEFSPTSLLESVAIAIGLIPADQVENQLLKLIENDKYTVQYEVTKAIANIQQKDENCFNRLHWLLKENKNRASSSLSSWNYNIEFSTAEAIATFQNWQAQRALDDYFNDNPLSPDNIKSIIEKYFPPNKK